MDEYLKERYELKSRWEAKLSDGTIVYQDDERNGSPSWTDLKEHVKNTGLKIEELLIGFRDNIARLPVNKRAYFFRNGLVASWGGFEKHYFVVGFVDGDNLLVSRYDLPEMIYQGSEEREIGSCEDGLIWNEKM